MRDAWRGLGLIAAVVLIGAAFFQDRGLGSALIVAPLAVVIWFSVDYALKPDDPSPPPSGE